MFGYGCLVLVLQLVGAAGALSLMRDHIQVHDGAAGFRRFYWVQNSTSTTRKHWTLQVNTRLFGEDFISFFATDIDRYITLLKRTIFAHGQKKDFFVGGGGGKNGLRGCMRCGRGACNGNAWDGRLRRHYTDLYGR